MFRLVAGRMIDVLNGSRSACSAEKRAAKRQLAFVGASEAPDAERLECALVYIGPELVLPELIFGTDEEAVFLAT